TAARTAPGSRRPAGGNPKSTDLAGAGDGILGPSGVTTPPPPSCCTAAPGQSVAPPVPNRSVVPPSRTGPSLRRREPARHSAEPNQPALRRAEPAGHFAVT